MEEDVVTLVKESLRKHSAIDDVSDVAKDETRLELITKDSYLNYVYRATSPDESKCCIIKVYKCYARAFGPNTPVELERCRREVEAIEYINSISPMSCPGVYFHDDVANAVCLHNLQDFRIWGDYLLKSCDLKAGAKLADILVTLHSSSHRLKIGNEPFEKLKQTFRPLPLQTRFLFEHQFVTPFSTKVEDQSTKARAFSQSVRQKVDEIRADAAVLKAVELVKDWMAVGAGDCCIHGDLHPGNIMLKGEDIKLIDLEWARVGAPAYDVALLVCNYVLFYHYHQERATLDGNEDDGLNHGYTRRHMLDLICITLSRYMDGMGRSLGESFDHHHLWKQVLLFLGVELIAWTAGTLSFPVLDDMPEAQLNCLNTALQILHKQSLSLGKQDISRLIHQ